MDVQNDLRSQRGFTLAEMMVVVAMIAIILGVTLPNMWRAAVRAEMMSQVALVQQTMGISRIYAIKNSSRVALRLLPDADSPVAKYEIRSWVDDNENGAPDAGEEEIGAWLMSGDIEIGVVLDPPDGNSADSDLDLHGLAGTTLGVVFFANGTAMTHGNQIGSGQGGVMLQDTYENVMRIRIQGGSGSVIIDMWNWELDDWIDNPKNLWRY